MSARHKNSNFWKLGSGEIRSLLLSGACATAFVMTGATSFAQEGADTDDENSRTLDKVVVTGTNIRGAEVVGSATKSISTEELFDSGRVTAGDFLRELPENFAGGVGIADEQQSGQDSGAAQANLTGGQGVNLRGLGALSTLVLINGRRAPGSGQFGDFVDIANIPTGAISQVEILKDGASAVYGSDAVGGVVNFILKRNGDTPLTTFRAGAATQGGGNEYLVSHEQPFNWSSGSAILVGEYYSRASVSTISRDPYSNGSDFSALGGVDWQFYTGRYSPATNIFLGGQGGSVGSPVGASVPAGSNDNLTNAELNFATGPNGNSFNVFDASDIIPKSERFSLYGAFDQDVTDSITLFGDARYTERTADYDLGYYTQVARSLPTTSPFYINDIDPSLTNGFNPRDPFALGSIPFGTVIDDRPMTRESSVESIGATLGARFDIYSDWTLETVATYARDDQQRIERQPRGANLRPDFLFCALVGPNGPCAGTDAIPWNPFSTDPLSDAQLQQYFGFEDLTFDSEVTELSAKVDGTAFSLPAGDVKFAIGADFRNEGIEGFLRENTINIAPTEGEYTRTERDAIALFAEVLVPVHERLDISLAGRYEEFDADYGSQYDDFNPKVGVNFRPVDDLLIRGSWGTSFHAPPMRFENDDPQPVPGGNAAFILPASRFGPCDSTLLNFNGIIGTPGTAGEQCSFSLIVNSGGAGPGVLEPEQAETWSLGFEYTPESVPGLTVGLNYFDIEVTDRIQRIQSGTLNQILAEFFATNGGGAFRSALILNPSEAEAQAIIDSGKFLGTFGPPLANSAADIQLIVNATQINIAALQETGFDFNASYEWDTGNVDWRAFVNGTYLTSYETQAAPTLDFIDQLGKYSSFGSPVALRSRQGISAASGPWNGTLTVNYVDDYECAAGSCFVPDATTGAPVSNANPVSIDSWITADLNVGYDLSSLGYGFAEGTRVALTVTNLFDEDAPFIDGGTGAADNLPSAYDPNNHTIIGRTVGVTVTKQW